jgi:two-component system, NtrC family, response regulator HupR/HoxA
MTRHVRIPLFARVDGQARGALGECYSTNLSAGGMFFKARSGAGVRVGSRVELGFDLGHRRLRTRAEVAWVDAAALDYRGARAHGFGVRFVELDADAAAAIQEFIESFRYRVAVVGAPDDDKPLLSEALAQSYRVEFLDEAPADGLQDVAVLVVHGADARFLGEPPSTPNPMRVVLCADALGDDALRLVNRGAIHYFLRRPLDPVDVRTVVGRAVEAFALMLENERLTGELGRAVDRLDRENRYLRSEVARRESQDAIVGASATTQRVRELIDRVAPLQTTVHIVGETGSGKELVARALHARSSRAAAPFVVQDCSTLSETLLESELFGHVAGAFTGARGDRPGLFAQADGGTVFLDEISNLPLAVQAKLLRVLEDRKVRPVGASQAVDVDIRLLSASNRDLREEVRRGRFRRDLYYRLVVFTIDVPPLRARREDVAPLAQHFLEQHNARHHTAVEGLDADAIRLLEGYDWPGNVRELMNEMERAAILCGAGGRVTAGMLSERLHAGAVTRRRHARSGLKRSVAEFERELIRGALERSGGAIAAAAADLGVERTTFAKKCARLGIVPRRARGGGAP